MIFPVLSSTAARLACMGTAPATKASRCFSCSKQWVTLLEMGIDGEPTGAMKDHSPLFLHRSLDGDVVQRT